MAFSRCFRNFSVTYTVLLSACMTPKSGSDVKHALGQIAVEAPSFLWHDVPNDEKKAFAGRQVNNPGEIVGEDTLIHQRTQEIVDRIDAAARAADPQGLRSIPKPKVVILNSDDFNAFVTSRQLCVKQPVEIEKLLDNTDQATPQASSGIQTVLSLAYPGSIYETSISDSAYSCKLVDGDQIGWNVQEFVKLYNERFDAKDRECFLKLRQNTIIIPEKTCGELRGKKYEFIEYSAAANTIFFLTKLLKSFDETQVATVAAHELAHYYRGHGSYKRFPPYFFQQSQKNELKKPDATNHHQDLQNKMLALSSLTTRPKINLAKYRPDLVSAAIPLSDLFKVLCMDPHPCKIPYSELLLIQNENLYSSLWDLLYTSPSKELQNFYMRFENALINTAAAVEISKLDELTKARIKDMFSYIAKIDPDLVLDDKHSNLSNYLTLCNDVIEKAIPNIKAPFIAGAKQNLGFYSTEEEADEVGMELAARIGISGLRGPGLFQKFNSEILKSDPYEDPRATPYSECSDLRRSGWVKDGKSASSVLLIDSLSNIHHGLCYREFNSYREWKEHNLDRLHNKDFSFAFDDKAWKEAVATIPVLQPATKSDSSSNSLRNRKNTIHEKPFCVFSPYKVELN